MGDRSYWIFWDVFGFHTNRDDGLVYYHRAAGFFHDRETKRILWLFAYEQNGVFYEFFSGERLGIPQEKPHPYYQRTLRSLTVEKTNMQLKFYAEQSGDECFGGAKQCSQVEFAKYLERYIPDRELLARAIRDYLEKQRENYRFMQKQMKIEAVERARRNDYSTKSAKTSWVDEMIDAQRK